MPSWSDGEGGGAVNAAVADILGSGTAAGDPLFFASAGNTALRHWCGAFWPDAEGLHQWRDGVTSNLLTPWGNDRVSVELYGPAAGGFEVSVHDTLTGQQVGRATVRRGTKAHAAGTCAVVRWAPLPQHRYEVRVRAARMAPTLAEPFHLVVLGGGLQHATARGSIPCPADGGAVCAVGAVDTEGRRHGYSSCGPNSRLPKPDFVAEVPFPSLWRDRPFAGTSAAAPQAAGIAALVWSRHPEWTAKHVATAMRGAAVDLGPPGHDCETGYGRIALP
jgi:subtilisin family serine protease